MEIIHSLKFYLKYKLTDERDDGRESEVLSHVVSSHAASPQIRLQSSRLTGCLKCFLRCIELLTEEQRCVQDGSGRRDRKSQTEGLLIDSYLMVIFYGRTVATTDAGALFPCTRGGKGGGLRRVVGLPL